MTRSLEAKGLWVLTTLRSSVLMPALSRAICAAGETAAAMKPFLARAKPKETSWISMLGLALSSRAWPRVVTESPQLPSAGWVWVPNVWTPSGRTGRRPARPSRVLGMIPSSASRVMVFFLETGTSTGNM